MGDIGTTIMLIIVIVLIVAMFALSYFRRKKYNNELSEMRNDLKIGDRVMTDTGVVGELVDSYEEDGFKYFVLKSGKGNNMGYFAVHANAIYYVFGKENQNEKKKSDKTEQTIKQPTSDNEAKLTEEKESETSLTKEEEEKPVEKAETNLNNKTKSSKNKTSKSKKSTKKSK